MWPQSFLIDILRNVRYAIPVERANFPEDWKRKARPQLEQDVNGGVGKGRGSTSPTRGCDQRAVQGMVQGTGGQQREYIQNPGHTGGSGQPPYGQTQQGGWWPMFPGGGYPGAHYTPPGAYPPPPQFHPQGGQQPSRDWRAGWNDTRNPKLKALMQDYLDETNGHVYLSAILTAAGKCQGFAGPASWGDAVSVIAGLRKRAATLSQEM